MSDDVPDEAPDDAYVEIVRSDTVWRFERAFLESNWTCLFGRGCKGILDRDATELNQGCCSLGAHFGDGPAGEAEAMNVDAYASMLTPDQFSTTPSPTRCPMTSTIPATGSTASSATASEPTPA